MNKDWIDQKTQIFLKLAPATELEKLVAPLGPDQRKSAVFKTIGTERYLSSLRVGEIDDADIAKKLFGLEQFFLHSKLVLDAAEEGLALKKSQGKQESVAKIEFFLQAAKANLRV
jgi:hypothetical protein